MRTVPIIILISLGHRKTIDDYLRALGRKFGAGVTPIDPGPVE